MIKKNWNNFEKYPDDFYENEDETPVISSSHDIILVLSNYYVYLLIFLNKNLFKKKIIWGSRIRNCKPPRKLCELIELFVIKGKKLRTFYPYDSVFVTLVYINS